MKTFVVTILSFILIFGLLLGIAESVNWDQYRPQLAQQLTSELGAKVALRGPISISVFPFPRLAADDAEFETDGLYVRAPSLRLATKFWPMLVGDIVLTRVEIINPEIRLAPQKWPVPDATAVEENPANVQLQNVSIQNGFLRLRMNDHEEILRGINLKLTAPNWQGPYQMNGNFLRDDMNWKFESVLGVTSASGTRPMEIRIAKLDNSVGIKWQGAFTSAPLTLVGDGLVEWAHSPPVIWAGEMNLADDVLTIERGVVAAGDAELGSVTGEYNLADGRWHDLSAALHNIQPRFLSAMPRLAKWHSWLKGQRITQLNFNWKDNQYENFKLTTAVLDVSKDKNDWLVQGKNAAAMFAQMTDSQASEWPTALSTPFYMKINMAGDKVNIRDLDFDQMHVSGQLSGEKLSLHADDLLWERWLSTSANWRSLLQNNKIREMNVKIDRMDIAPFGRMTGEINLFLDENADQLLWRAGGLQLTGTWEGKAFTGRLSCNGRVNIWPLVQSGCIVADVNGDQNVWRLTPPDTVPANALPFDGKFNFSDKSWSADSDALGGNIAAHGRMGNDDWKLALKNLSLAQFLKLKIPAAGDASGKISGDMLIINDNARGGIDVRDMNLSALNLLATDQLAANSEIQNHDLRQAGKINVLKTGIKWIRDVIWFEGLQTEGPIGHGKASIDLGKKEWSGEWQGGGARVMIDGPINSSFAKTRDAAASANR